MVQQALNLAFVNDLDIVPVWIEHPGRIIAWIVFEPGLRSMFALASGVHSRFVECVYLMMVFGGKSNMHRLRIGLAFFEPEKSSFAVTKTLQIRVSVLAFVIGKICDPKWLQGLGVKSDGTLEITDCENNVVDHILLARLQIHDFQPQV
jgi:hypothetical protein